MHQQHPTTARQVTTVPIMVPPRLPDMEIPAHHTDTAQQVQNQHLHEPLRFLRTQALRQHRALRSQRLAQPLRHVALRLRLLGRKRWETSVVIVGRNTSLRECDFAVRVASLDEETLIRCQFTGCAYLETSTYGRTANDLKLNWRDGECINVYNMLLQ